MQRTQPSVPAVPEGVQTAERAAAAHETGVWQAAVPVLPPVPVQDAPAAHALPAPQARPPRAAAGGRERCATTVNPPISLGWNSVRGTV